MKFGLNSLSSAPSGDSESCSKQDQKDSHSSHWEHESGQKLNINGCVEIRKNSWFNYFWLTSKKKYKQGLGRNILTVQIIMPV